MATLAEKWKEEGRAQGLERGLEKGLQAQRQTLLHLLDWRFHLSETQKAAYRQQIAQVSDLRLLSQLIDHLLAAQTLTEFDGNLLACLSPAQDS